MTPEAVVVRGRPCTGAGVVVESDDDDDVAAPPAAAGVVEVDIVEGSGSAGVEPSPLDAIPAATVVVLLSTGGSGAALAGCGGLLGGECCWVLGSCSGDSEGIGCEVAGTATGSVASVVVADEGVGVGDGVAVVDAVGGEEETTGAGGKGVVGLGGDCDVGAPVELVLGVVVGVVVVVVVVVALEGTCMSSSDDGCFATACIKGLGVFSLLEELPAEGVTGRSALKVGAVVVASVDGADIDVVGVDVG